MLRRPPRSTLLPSTTLFRSATSHAVTVRVTDQGGLTTTQTFTLAVDRESTRPNSSHDHSSYAIFYFKANGTVVAQVAGHDPDTAHGDVLSYALTDNAGGRFAIDATSGVITVANGSLLDYEAATSHAVTVRVTDQGGLTTTQTFALAVTDVNEAPSAITLASGGAITSEAHTSALESRSDVEYRHILQKEVLTYALTDNAGGR